MMQEILESVHLNYVIVTLCALMLCILALPSIMHVANRHSLFDQPNISRKLHKQGISSLGGVAIFCSFMITCLLFSRINQYNATHYMLASCIILFAVGLKDDLYGVNASTKFVMQFLVAGMMVFMGKVYLTSMYSVFNLYDLPMWGSAILTILVIMFVINAFNLIDGINGLAGTIGVIVNLTFGYFFVTMDQHDLACIAFAISGAILGFLRYNYTPAKIFMGDTGALLIGLISVFLAIQFIELNNYTKNPAPLYKYAPSVSVAVLIVPIFDAVRVFVLRIVKKQSPFKADSNHIHHKLVISGLSHTQATILLASYNILCIAFALYFMHIGNFTLISLLFVISIIFNLIITWVLKAQGVQR